MLTVGLAGNPNTGKSTIFNALTGARQHVGNWPGKTVAKKEGTLHLPDGDIVLVDLPGTYSLTSFSVEEVIARDFIVEDSPHAIVCIADAANLERNLYLVVQVLEMGVPTIVALNMCDVAAQRGIQIDTAKLSTLMGGIPIIATTGSRGKGLDTLRSAIADQTSRSKGPSEGSALHFSELLEKHIALLSQRIAAEPTLNRYAPRWLAIKLLENDTVVRANVAVVPSLGQAVDQAIAAIAQETGEDPDTLIADARYAFIRGLMRSAVTRPIRDVITVSDRLDGMLTHRLWGIPIFLLLMWTVFQVTANVSAPLKDFLTGVVGGPITHWAMNVLGVLGLNGTWVESLLVKGVVAGVGSVLAFVPVLLSLYFAISILEDSGYMARAAFVMDRLMNKLGLHGKSFLPLLVGFGCTVPAVYATRTLENEQDRKVTAFLATFMSCGARLPVYALFGSAFFGSAAGNLIFGMYVFGIGVAIVTSLLFTKIIFRDKPVPPFVMELPPYRIPDPKTVWTSTRQRTVGFVQKAGTVILVASVAIWLLLAIPVGKGQFGQVDPAESLFATASKVAAPVFAPAGFGKWQASGALITGLLAKEVVIATMGQVYVGSDTAASANAPTTFGQDVQEILTGFGRSMLLTVQEAINIVPHTINLIPGIKMPQLTLVSQSEAEEKPIALYTALNNAFTPLSAVAFCVFVLLYVPCMSATAALRHEFGVQWMLIQVAYTFGVAWFAATVVYQCGRLIGLGG